MIRKSRNTARRVLKAPLFILLASFAGTFAISGLSSAAIQSQSAPTLRIVSEDGNRLPVVIITGDDIRNLPPGENRIIQKFEGGNPATATTRPTGSVTFYIDNIRTGASFNLTKTGTGTLILPNTYRGTTTVNSGVLNSANNTSLRKHGQGTLTLAGANSGVASEQLTLSGIGTPVVHEFRNIEPAELDRIFMPGETSSVMARITGLKKVTAQLGTSMGIQDWPIAPVLIIPAKGIGKVEGWNPGVVSNATAGTEYKCVDGFCACAGQGCNGMIKACSSAITCGSGGLVCACKR